MCQNKFQFLSLDQVTSHVHTCSDEYLYMYEGYCNVCVSRSFQSGLPYDSRLYTVYLSKEERDKHIIYTNMEDRDMVRYLYLFESIF